MSGLPQSSGRGVGPAPDWSSAGGARTRPPDERSEVHAPCSSVDPGNDSKDGPARSEAGVQASLFPGSLDRTSIPAVHTRAGPVQTAAIENRVPSPPYDRAARRPDRQPRRRVRGIILAASSSTVPATSPPATASTRNPRRPKPFLGEWRRPFPLRAKSRDHGKAVRVLNCGRLATNSACSAKLSPGRFDPDKMSQASGPDWGFRGAPSPAVFLVPVLLNSLRRNVMESIDSDSPRADSSRRSRCDVRGR